MNWLESIELDEIEAITATEETAEERSERFKITDLASMNWALRKLTALNKNFEEESALAQAETQRIQKWYAKQAESYRNSVQFLEGLISEFAKAQRVINPKWKSKTPYGVVSFRKAKKYNYGDEEKLVKFLDENGMSEYVKVVKSPIKTELKKALTITTEGKAIFTSTGELLPDVTAEEVEEVTIKVEG